MRTSVGAAFRRCIAIWCRTNGASRSSRPKGVSSALGCRSAALIDSADGTGPPATPAGSRSCPGGGPGSETAAGRCRAGPGCRARPPERSAVGLVQKAGRPPLSPRKKPCPAARTRSAHRAAGHGRRATSPHPTGSRAARRCAHLPPAPRARATVRQRRPRAEQQYLETLPAHDLSPGHQHQLPASASGHERGLIRGRLDGPGTGLRGACLEPTEPVRHPATR